MWRRVSLQILLRGLTFFLRQVILMSWQKWSLRTYLNAILLYVLGVVSDDNFSTVKFPSSTSTHDIKDKYIYAAFNSITYDKESCASLCYTHTISSTACQFFILYSDTCMLGNFQSTETYTSPQDSFTAYFNESEYTKLKKLNFQNTQGRWRLQQKISVNTHAMRAWSSWA